MNNIVPIGQARMPAAMKARLQQGTAVNKNFADGVVDSYPRLSIRGKTFRIRRDGKELLLTDNYNQAVPNLDVILVNASRTIAKTYFEKGFDPSDATSPPDCWSLDSIKPDPSVINKVNPTCVDCKYNAFGSRVSDRGGTQRAGKACSDSRRIAVVMPGDLGNPQPMTFLLSVPQGSLKNLKEYAQLLERQGWEPAACVTRLQFDPEAEFPKLRFYFVDGLTDAEYATVVDMAESPATAAMLNAPNFDEVAGKPQGSNTETAARVRQEMPKMQDPDEVVPEERAPMQRATPRQPQTLGQEPTSSTQTMAHPVQATERTLIELPDGQLFDPSTGEYVERPQPKVEMPQADPATVALPDGRFFNQTTRQFVTGPEVGAPAVSVEEPPKRRAPRKVKAPAAPVAETEEAAPEESEASEPESKTVSMDISAAPAGLEDVLRSVLPSRK